MEPMIDNDLYDIKYTLEDGSCIYLKKYSIKKLGVVCPVDIHKDIQGWEQYKNQLPSILNIPREVRCGKDSYIVEIIADNAFRDCDNLKKVVLPLSISCIVGHAFYNCRNLKNVIKRGQLLRLDDSAFERCSALFFDDIVKLKSIVNNDAYFQSDICKNPLLPKMRIVSNIEKKDEEFSEKDDCEECMCVNVENGSPLYFKILSNGKCKISMPVIVFSNGSRSVKGVKVTKPYGNIVVPKIVEYNGAQYQVTALGRYAFYGCLDLESIELPDTISLIESNAIVGCSNIKKLVIPQSVIKISSSFMYGCCPKIINNSDNYIWKDGLLITNDGKELIFASSDLKEVEIPNTVKNIGNYAFKDCKQLKQVKMPQSITSIGIGAFCGCEYLYQINIPDGITKIPDEAFAGCVRLENIILSDNITMIGAGAFLNCESIEYFDIPKEVKEIKKNTFAECKGLKEMVIPETVEMVRNNAFLNCVGLKHVIICNRDTDVKECAFLGCINCVFDE